MTKAKNRRQKKAQRHYGKPSAPRVIGANDARLVAGLQALTLALHIGGLEGLRSGAVKLAHAPKSVENA